MSAFVIKSHLWPDNSFASCFLDINLGILIDSMEPSPSWKAASLLKNFMEPEGSLPCSQEPYLAPILSQMNPVHITISLKIILIIPFHILSWFVSRLIMLLHLDVVSGLGIMLYRSIFIVLLALVSSWVLNLIIPNTLKKCNYTTKHWRNALCLRMSRCKLRSPMI
jgi:hypothetical protein